MERKYTEEMREISGFGGGYEETCRNMVLAALDWLDENPEADLSYKTFKQVYGLTTDESDDMKTMQGVMVKAANNDCTGAMMQATCAHVMFIRKEGWEKYVEEMSKEDSDDE